MSDLTLEGIRAVVRAELDGQLGPIRADLARLSGLPQTAADLGTEVVRLRSVVERLDPRVDEHSIALVSLERTLKRMEPLLQRFADIADHVMPELIRKQQGMQGEIERDRADRESQRAAGAKT